MKDPYSHAEIRRIAVPMIITAVSTPLLGMVDTAVMGHLDEPVFLGAVAAGATIFSILFMGLNFLRMGTTGITAQAFGAADQDTLRTALGQPAIVAVILATSMILLREPIFATAMWALSPSESVGAATAMYFDIRIWSAPFSLLNFVLIGWLLGMQNARGPLVIVLVGNSVNIVLDLVFVLLLGMTADGVALATVIAEVVGGLIGIVFVRAELADHPGHWLRAQFVSVVSYGRLFDVNANLFLRTMALMFVFAFITARGARMGDVILAVNALLMNFQYFLAYALDGIALAAEALVGKATGGRDYRGIRRVVRRTMQWSLLVATGFVGLYALAGPLIIGLLTDIPELRVAARDYLPWLIVSPLISVWSFLYDGVFVGLTRTRELMIIMVGSAAAVFLPVWALSQPLGNHGLWLAFTAFMLARGIGMQIGYVRIQSRLAAV